MIDNLQGWKVPQCVVFNEFPSDPDLSNITVTEKIRQQIGNKIGPEAKKRYEEQEARVRSCDLVACIIGGVYWSLVGIGLVAIITGIAIFALSSLPNPVVVLGLIFGGVGLLAIVGGITPILEMIIENPSNYPKITEFSPHYHLAKREELLGELKKCSFREICDRQMIDSALDYDLFSNTSSDRQRQLQIYALAYKLQEHLNEIERRHQEDLRKVQSCFSDYTHNLKNAVQRSNEAILKTILDLNNQDLSKSIADLRELKKIDDERKSLMQNWQNEQIAALKKHYEPAYQRIETLSKTVLLS